MSTNNIEKHAITIMEAIRSDSDELWVLNVNRMAVNAHSDRSRVSLHINDSNRLMIEASFIPQNLVEIGDRDVIVNSSEFKRAVNSGLLKIIDPAAANEFMKSRTAQVEYARIQNIRNEVINASTGALDNNALPQPAALGERKSTRQLNNHPHANENDVIPGNDINPVILNIMANAKETESDALHASVKNCGDERLKAADYRHVMEEANKAGHAKLGRWAERQMVRKQEEATSEGEYGED